MTRQWKILISVLLGVVLGVVSYVLGSLTPRRQLVTTTAQPAMESSEAAPFAATAEDLPIREPVLE